MHPTELGPFDPEALRALETLPKRVSHFGPNLAKPARWFTNGHLLLDVSMHQRTPKAEALAKRVAAVREKGRRLVDEEGLRNVMPPVDRLNAVRFTSLWTHKAEPNPDDEVDASNYHHPSICNARFSRGLRPIADLDAGYLRLCWQVLGPWDVALCEDAYSPLTLHFQRRGELRLGAIIMPRASDLLRLAVDGPEVVPGSPILRAGDVEDHGAPLPPRYAVPWPELGPLAPKADDEVRNAWALDGLVRLVRAVGGTPIGALPSGAGWMAKLPQKWSLPTRVGPVTMRVDWSGARQEKNVFVHPTHVTFEVENYLRLPEASTELRVQSRPVRFSTDTPVGTATTSFPDAEGAMAYVRRVLADLALAPAARPSRFEALPFTPPPWPGDRYQIEQAERGYRVTDRTRPSSGGLGRTLDFSLASAVAWRMNDADQVGRKFA